MSRQAHKHILIFEPEANGHQMNYIRHLLDRVDTDVENARVTLLTTADAAAHSNCQNLLGDFPDLVTLRIAPAVTEGNRVSRAIHPFYERQWRHAEIFSRGFAEIGPDTVDFVILPHLEAIGLPQLAARPALFRGKPWATIAHAIRFHHRESGIDTPFRALDLLQRLCFRRVLRDPNLRCFGTSDPYFPRAVSHPVVAHCPDPSAAPSSNGRDNARAAYGIQPGACVVLVFGFIDRRKCIDALLESVMRAATVPGLTVLLAGAQHAGHIGPVLSGQTAQRLRDQGRLLEVNRFIDFARDVDPMCAADMVWLYYEPDFVRNSAVLTQAGLARLPVIARDRGLIARQVRDFRLGLTVASENPDEIAAALTRLAQDPALRETMGDNGARTFAENTPANFARPIVDAINRTFATPTIIPVA